MTDSPTRRVTVNGVLLAWDAWGDEVSASPPLVLCHGFGGSAFDFVLEVESLASDRYVVALDQRGHGLSEKTHDLASYTVAELSDDLAGFIESTTTPPVDLLGHSLGGRVVLGTVLQRPDLVRSVILMDTSAWSFVPEDPGMREMMGGFIESFDPAGELPDPASMRGPEDDLVEAMTPQSWRDHHLELYSTFDTYAFKALGSELFGSQSLSVRDRLAEITCPVTVLVGENDHPFVDQAPALAAELPQGRLVVIGGAYHSPQLTHPEAWRAALEEHLGRLG